MLKNSAAVLILSLAIWFHAQAQDKPGGPSTPVSIAVFDLSACFDRDKVDKVKEVDQELKAKAEEFARRIQESPQERETLRAEYLAFYDRKKLELYGRVDQVISAIAKERNYIAVFKLDRHPQQPANSGDATLSQQIDRRTLFYSAAQVDITADVLKRLNENFAPKKNF